jgi:transposase
VNLAVSIPHGSNIQPKYTLSLFLILLKTKQMSQLEKILKNAAGIDIGSEKVFVAVEGQPVKSFRTFTSTYKELGMYLREQGIERVAMEATGIYWVTLYDILEAMGFEVCLVNPADSKNLPGRKTDVLDCQWIQTLYSYGLLKKSFVPDDIVRKLRVYTRMREDKLQMGAAHINHMQKALIQMNIRLPEVLSQTHGASGLAMIQAILKGERDVHVLLNYCTTDLKKRKGNDILLALEGNYKQEYIFELQQAYDGYMFYLNQVKLCDIEAGKILNDFHHQSNKDFKDDNKPKPIRHNKPDINNLHEMLLGIHGANPTVLPGLTDYSLMRLTAELGNNIDQWPNVKSFVSWLGLAPGRNQSGKMNKRSKKRAITRAGQIFKQAGQSLLLSTKLGLGVFAKKLKARRGAGIAIKATARKLAELYYNLFKNGLQYVESGIVKYEQQQKERQLKYLNKKANELNLQLISI